MNDLEDSEDSSRSKFNISMNEMILEMIKSNEMSETDLSDEEGGWSHKELSAFVDFTDSEKHLPMPVTTNSTPFNPHHFLTHVVLSLGKYDTEIAALTHGSYRECFQAASLIGDSDEREHLQECL